MCVLKPAFYVAWFWWFVQKPAQQFGGGPRQVSADSFLIAWYIGKFLVLFDSLLVT